MLWLLLALATAFFNASAAAVTKRHFAHLRPLEIGTIPIAYAGLLCLLSLPFIQVPQLDSTFWWAWGFSLPLMLLAVFFQFWAIGISPLSLTMPYLSFTPAFVILTGYLILDEILNSWGLLGVLSIAIGGYVLNIQPGKGRGILAPLKAVFQEPGSWRMLIAAIIFSFCGVLGRMAVLHSSPLFFPFTFVPALGASFLLIGFLTRQVRIYTLWQKPGFALLAGLCVTLENFFHHLSIAMVKAAYMLAVKRLNTLISVIYGGVIFKEKNLVFRFAGTILMIMGAAIIGLLGE